MPDIRRHDWAEMSNVSPDDFDDPDFGHEAPSTRQGSGGDGPGNTARVVDAHLRARKQQRMEDDIDNFDPAVVILSSRGVYHGHDGVRQFWRDLEDDLPAGRFSYAEPRAGGDAAMIEWQARATHAYVENGVDSYVVRNGRIVVQTVHYTLLRPA